MKIVSFVYKTQITHGYSYAGVLHEKISLAKKILRKKFQMLHMIGTMMEHYEGEMHKRTPPGFFYDPWVINENERIALANLIDHC